MKRMLGRPQVGGRGANPPKPLDWGVVHLIGIQMFLKVSETKAVNFNKVTSIELLIGKQVGDPVEVKEAGWDVPHHYYCVPLRANYSYSFRTEAPVIIAVSLESQDCPIFIDHPLLIEEWAALANIDLSQ